MQTAQDNPSAESSPVTESYEIVKNSASTTSDASPNSEVSSPSSFEQISGDQEREGEPEEAGDNTEEEGGEEILLDQPEDKEEEESGVRHRKSGHVEEHWGPPKDLFVSPLPKILCQFGRKYKSQFRCVCVLGDVRVGVCDLTTVTGLVTVVLHYYNIFRPVTVVWPLLAAMLGRLQAN